MILNYDSNYFMQKAIDEAKFGLNKGEVPRGNRENEKDHFV